MSLSIRKNLFYLILVLAWIGFSFFQHYSTPLDGDMPSVILPTDIFQQVLDNPFGWDAIVHGEKYGATNRYFVHQTMFSYFRSVPFLFQKIVDPIQSVYTSAALFKILLQISLLYLLVQYVVLTLNVKENSFLTALILIPLFQHGVYNNYLGVICNSITYTIFYTFPLTVLLWFFLPFFRSYFISERGKYPFTLKHILLTIILGVFLAFSGPLVSPVILLICPVVLVYTFYEKWKQRINGIASADRSTKSPSSPIKAIGIFIFIILLSTYSLFLGTLNIENNDTVSLLERYTLLPTGFFKQLTNRPAVPILLIMIGINIFLMKRVSMSNDLKNERISLQDKLLKNGKIILLFSVGYILLLPLGGYREYRPFILRADTLMPVNLGMFYFYGVTTLFLLQNLNTKIKRFYTIVIMIFSILFLTTNNLNWEANHCEKAAFYQLQNSNQTINGLESQCNIMSWQPFYHPKETMGNAKLLELWGITDSVRLYYHTKLPY